MPNHAKCSHPWTVHTSRLLMSKNSIKNVLENLFLMFGRGKTQNRAKTHRPSMSAFSAIFVLKVNGTHSHSAKFLNWGDHVNWVPDLAASPPWSWPNRQVPSLVPGSKNTSPLIFCHFRIFEHCQATGHNINPPNVKVLFDKNNTIKRRVKEAIAIKQRKPPWIWMRDWTFQQFTVLSTLMKSEWFGWNIRFVSYFFALTFGIFCTN